MRATAQPATDVAIDKRPLTATSSTGRDRIGDTFPVLVTIDMHAPSGRHGVVQIGDTLVAGDADVLRSALAHALTGIDEQHRRLNLERELVG